jgi:uncharacterized protein (TIGR03437 family)
VAVLSTGAAVAQPVVSSAVNAASYALPELPSSGIARGSMFVIFGQRLGPANLSTINSFPLPLQLAGTGVRVTVGASAIDAYLIYTSAGQVAAILPSNTPEGNGTLTVTYNGQTSAPLQIRVVRSSFGTFSVNQAGSGPGIVQNVNSEADRPINALNKPVRPGQVVILWGTGLGPVTADERAGAVPGDLPINVEVYVGGRLAQVTYKGRSGCCAGIDQIVFTVPQGVEGCYIPVVVKIGDVVSNFTTIAVSQTNTCTDPAGFSGEDIQRAQTTGTYRIGGVTLSRVAIKLTVPVLGTIESKTDSASAFFSRYNLDQLLRSQGGGSGVSVSIGSCSVYTARSSSPGNVDPVRPDVLNAGPVININGPRGAKQLQRSAEGFYSAQLGGGTAIPGGPPAQPDYLEPGSYRIDNGSGGTDVGAFSVTLTIPQALTWTNIDAVNTITRSSGQEITWSGGDPTGYTVISGSSANNNVVGGFACLERTNVGRFTIPAYVLLNLPQSAGDVGGTLIVAGSTANARFTASGLDNGYVTAGSGSGKTVAFR